MVIDTSALTAILRKEADRDSLLQALVKAPRRLLSSVTALETSMVIEGRHGREAVADLELFLYTAQIEIVAFDAKQYELAQRAWRKYGKRNHPAGLNLGDCCVYALAKLTGEPVLSKGSDFPLTDLPLSVP